MRWDRACFFEMNILISPLMKLVLGGAFFSVSLMCVPDVQPQLYHLSASRWGLSKWESVMKPHLVIHVSGPPSSFEDLFSFKLCPLDKSFCGIKKSPFLSNKTEKIIAIPLNCVQGPCWQELSLLSDKPSLSLWTNLTLGEFSSSGNQ